MNDQTIEERIAARTDLTIAGATAVSAEVGGLSFKDMGQVMEFSKLMAVSGQAVPKHLRAQPGACLAVSLQALNWRMDPFAVANKSYSVNDRIAYEAQLIHAVIEQRAPIKGRIKGALEGEGQKRRWRLWCETTDGDRIDYEGPEIGAITTKNSPLWKADPDQQLWYYSVRAMCRRHFPDVILGVYEKEEIQNAEPMRDVTPKEGGFASVAMKARGEPEAQERAAEAEVLLFADLPTDDAFPGSDAFTTGADAYSCGAGIEACPFDHGSQDAVDWCGGWRGAERAAQ